MNIDYAKYAEEQERRRREWFNQPPWLVRYTRPLDHKDHPLPHQPEREAKP